MKIFVLSDPHLGFRVDKPMDRFGRRWEAHSEKIAHNWKALVGEDDSVLIPGDISWALRLDEALDDLRFLHELPGRKILLRGNHDYWWQSLAKVETFCLSEGFTSLSFLQNTAIPLGDEFVVAGSRLWLWNDDPRFKAADQKIFSREEIRLRLSLEAAKEFTEKGRRLLVMLHYPPFPRNLRENSITAMISEAGAEAVYFGHIHQQNSPYAFTGKMVGGIPYSLCSADYLNFTPVLAAQSSALRSGQEGEGEDHFDEI